MNMVKWILSFLVTMPLWAGVKVTTLQSKMSGKNQVIEIGLNGRTQELPDIKVSKNQIEVMLTGIEQFQSFFKNLHGVKAGASFVGGKAFVTIALPNEVKEEQVQLNLKPMSIEISFPKSEVVQVQKSVVKEVVTKKEQLNIDYLNKLEGQETKQVAQIEHIDEVKQVQAAPQVEKSKEIAKNDQFSFAGYLAKFTVFLGLVLALFYGVVQLFKKGVLGKGKMGFLNNSQMIEVLSTTYISPKRSLMMVKAHKQIFFIANSENGIQFLSEVSDTAGLIKEGERLVTGSNFDLSLDEVSAQETKNFSLKENIMESKPLPEEKGISSLSAKDIVKFSDELKKKAKKLKPIEFN